MIQISSEYNPHIIQISFHRFFFDPLASALVGGQGDDRTALDTSARNNILQKAAEGPDALGCAGIWMCVYVDTCMLHDHITLIGMQAI